MQIIEKQKNARETKKSLKNYSSNKFKQHICAVACK